MKFEEPEMNVTWIEEDVITASNKLPDDMW